MYLLGSVSQTMSTLLDIFSLIYLEDWYLHNQIPSSPLGLSELMVYFKMGTFLNKMGSKEMADAFGDQHC